MKSEWDKGMKLTWGDIISLEYGKPVPDKFQTNGDVPVFGTNGQIGTSNLPPLCSHASTIVGRKGAYRGVHYSNVPFSVIDTAFFVEETTKLTDSKWIYYKLLTLDINRMDSGSAIPSTDRSEIYSLPVTVPPLPTQRKIASILSALDDKIEINNAICRNLEEQAMALYKSWFVDFEPFGGIAPNKWEKGILGDFISCNPQLTKGKYMGTFIDMKALPTSGYCISTFLHKIKATGTKFQNGDVLMARITPCLENGKTGIVWGLEEDEVGRGSTEFIVLRGKEAPLTSYIACLSRDDTFRDYAIKRMNGSSGRQRVQASDIIQYPILVPSKEVLCRFENTVSSFFGGIKARSDENDYLSKLRDTLLPKLMSGELSVENIN